MSLSFAIYKLTNQDKMFSLKVLLFTLHYAHIHIERGNPIHS